LCELILYFSLLLSPAAAAIEICFFFEGVQSRNVYFFGFSSIRFAYGVYVFGCCFFEIYGIFIHHSIWIRRTYVYIQIFYTYKAIWVINSEIGLTYVLFLFFFGAKMREVG